MSMLFENSASISDGPALKTLADSLDGATALAKSPDATPSAACACVTLPKYPSRTSAGGAAGDDSVSLVPQPSSTRSVAIASIGSGRYRIGGGYASSIRLSITP